MFPKDVARGVVTAVEKDLNARGRHKMSHITRKCVFGFSTRLDSNWPAQLQRLVKRLEISAIASTGIILSTQRTTKALIRLRGCAGWSAPLLFAYSIRHVFAWPGPNGVWKVGQGQLFIVCARRVISEEQALCTWRFDTRSYHSCEETDFNGVKCSCRLRIYYDLFNPY